MVLSWIGYLSWLSFLSPRSVFLIFLILWYTRCDLRYICCMPFSVHKSATQSFHFGAFSGFSVSWHPWHPHLFKMCHIAFGFWGFPVRPHFAHDAVAWHWPRCTSPNPPTSPKGQVMQHVFLMVACEIKYIYIYIMQNLWCIYAAPPLHGCFCRRGYASSSSYSLVNFLNSRTDSCFRSYRSWMCIYDIWYIYIYDTHAGM